MDVTQVLQDGGAWTLVAVLGLAAWRQLESMNGILRDHLRDMRGSIDALTKALERREREPTGRVRNEVE